MSVPKLPPSTSGPRGVRQRWGDALPGREGKEKRGWDSTGTPREEQPHGAVLELIPAIRLEQQLVEHAQLWALILLEVPAPWMPPGLGQRGSGGTSPIPVHSDAKHLGMRPLD